MSVKSSAERALEQGKGILRLAPNWVPRVYCVPGRRIKLHPDDYYALGSQRGGIDERWFASTTPADNGPLTAPNEGLSFILFEDGPRTERILLRDAIEDLKGIIVGQRIWNEHRRWPMYAKFFDNKGALPHHIHQRDEHARLTGQLGKPEAYYFPPQANNHTGDFPVHLLRAQSRDHESPASRMPRGFRQGRQQDYQYLPRVSPGDRDRLGCAAGSPARARQPVHL